MLKIDENSRALDEVIDYMSIGEHEPIQRVKILQSVNKQNNDSILNVPAEIKVIVKNIGAAKTTSNTLKRMKLVAK